MKKLFICIAMMLVLGVNNSSAQYRYNEKTKTFTSDKPSRSAVKDTLVTEFLYEDAAGRKYPVIINRGTGSCYIWKRSGKSGKDYKQYMSKDISMEVCRRLKIEYKPATKK